MVSIVKSHKDYLAHNTKLLEIYKGQLMDKIEAKIREQFEGQSAAIAIHRIPPINVLTRIIKKSSKIYSNGVRREVVGGTETDAQIFNYLVDTIKPNKTFAVWNRYFNLFQCGLVQPYLNDAGIPSVRTIPGDRYIPFSTNSVDPGKPTGFIIYMGTIVVEGSDKPVDYYMAIDAMEFKYFTLKEQDITAQVEPGSPDGFHGFGAVPFVYTNSDHECILPIQDTDIIPMTLVIPVLLTDINYAHMFQSFSIIYGVNLTDKGIKFAPNAFWSFEQQEGDERAPSIGTITPTADISSGLSLVANQFALWLNTKGIKPGDVGEVNGANFSSGISKIMDEMDTSENRSEQVPYFVDGEAEFWDLVLKKMLPRWQQSPKYNGVSGTFSSKATVTTHFSEQVPLVRRGQLIDDSIKELNAGLITKRMAIKSLNPQMTEQKIDELMTTLDELSGASSEALNGAQVESMAGIIEKIGLGIIPKESGKIILTSAFGLSDEVANGIVGPIKEGSITPEQVKSANAQPNQRGSNGVAENQD